MIDREIYVKNKYGEIYTKITGNDIQELLCSLKSRVDELENVNTGTESNEKNLSRSKAMKKRLVKADEENSNGYYHQEILTASLIYEKVDKNYWEQSVFKELYKVDNIDEYKASLLEKLRVWANDESKKITTFAGFDLLSKSIKVNAIKYDILTDYYEILQKCGVVNVALNEEKVKKVTKVPSVLGVLGIDSSNKLPFFNVNDFSEIESDISSIDQLDKKFISSDLQSEIVMQLERELYLRLRDDKASQDIITQIALVKALKEFNMLDVLIINLFYTNLYNVVSGEFIEMYVSDISKELGYQLRSDRFDAIKDSLCKLSSLRLFSDNYEGELISGYLLEARFTETDKGTLVKVYLGNFLRELAMLNSTFNFNKFAFDQLSGDAQLLAIWLQNRRLKRIAKGESNVETIATAVFGNALMARLSNLSRVKKRIGNALQELKDSKLVISEFNPYPKYHLFDIEYILLPTHIVDKIKNNKMKSGDLVEGEDYETPKII
ncbi:MAG: hypothetical protein ACRC68_06385 [Clostridium sp.]